MEYMEMYGIERRRPGAAGAMKSRVYPINERYFQFVDEPNKESSTDRIGEQDGL
jgi:hypothetical protein